MHKVEPLQMRLPLYTVVELCVEKQSIYTIRAYEKVAKILQFTIF